MAKKKKVEKDSTPTPQVYNKQVYYVMDTGMHKHLVEYVITLSEIDRGIIVEMAVADNGTCSNPGEIVASVINDGNGYKWIKLPVGTEQDYLEAYIMTIMYHFLNEVDNIPAEFSILKVV
jgi:hypothetical protein